MTSQSPSFTALHGEHGGGFSGTKRIRPALFGLRPCRSQLAPRLLHVLCTANGSGKTFKNVHHLDILEIPVSELLLPRATKLIENHIFAMYVCLEVSTKFIFQIDLSEILRYFLQGRSVLARLEQG